MSDPSPTYSQLSAEQQEALSTLIVGFEQRYDYEGAAALARTIETASPELRGPLLAQLLPPLIDQERTRTGRTPTLHELRLQHPNLTTELGAAYVQIPEKYRLPTELRGYRVLRVVGEGGQAVVLRAQDDVHSAVAIKLSSAPEHNELILRERRLLGECSHPGIPEVIASGVENERAFFMMPFLRGMTLADKYASHRPEPAEVARIGAELCSVVAHLHARCILHRDIKPQNVWLDEQGNVKLIDFGMAIDRASWGETRPAIEEFHGTPAFMSPEQAASNSEQDGELSDVFSIGATLYWLGTGTAPFEGSSGESVITRASAGRYDPDRLEAKTDWPKSMVRACLDAMATNPAERLSSAAEFGRRLQDAATGPSASETRSLAKPIAVITSIALIVVAATFASSDAGRSWLNRLAVEQPAEEPSVPDEVPEASVSDPVDDPWIDRIAAENEINLADIEADDFRISVNCLPRLIVPWGAQKRSPAASPEITVRVADQLLPLAEALEWRTGDLSWTKLQPTAEVSAYSTLLSRLAVGDHGPVEVRLVSDPNARSETAVGPFHIDFDIAQALVDDEQAFGRELLKEATTEKCFDVTQPGWTIRDEYSRRMTPIIDSFWFGVKKDGPMTSVSESQFEKLAKSSESEVPLGSYSLQQAFSLASKQVQDSSRLWIGINFSGGGTWGPVLYEKPLTEAQKEKQRVLTWFDRLGPDDELAKLRQTEFLPTRLNEVLSSLTHLHFVGTRRYVNGDPTHVRANQAGQEAKIEDRPSSEMVVDLSNLKGDRTIELPPVWSPVMVKGRFPDGTFTPPFDVYNSQLVFCCCSVSPFDASSRKADRELYVYIEDDTLPSRRSSILPFLPNPERLSPKTLKGCERTRLSLASPLPEGAVRAEYYSDSKFTDRIESAQPGILYARYVTADRKTLGYSAYKLSDAFMRVWVEHALRHADGTE